MVNFVSGVVAVVALYFSWPWIKTSIRKNVMVYWDNFINEVSTQVGRELRKRGDA